MSSWVDLQGFSDKDRQNLVRTFSIRLGAHRFSQVHENLVTFQTRKTGPDAALQFRAAARHRLSFDFILDDTGIIESGRDVPTSIEMFRKTAYDYNRQDHSPNYLTLICNAHRFECRMTLLDISYELFSPSGQPLRAKLKVEFIQDGVVPQIPGGTTRSPDLTHIEEPISTDTLPLR